MVKNCNSGFRNLWNKRPWWRNIKKFVELPNCHSAIFLYKSISIKQSKNYEKQNKNYGKHKSQIRNFGFTFPESLVFKNQMLSKAVQNWHISLASVMLLWEIHLRQEAIYTQRIPGLYLNANCLHHCHRVTWHTAAWLYVGLKNCQHFTLAYHYLTCETIYQMKTKDFSY